MSTRRRTPQAGRRRLCKGLARLAAPGAALTSALSSPAMQHALVSAGFKIDAGDATTPSVDRLCRRVTPRHSNLAARHPRSAALMHLAQALIVGAGLAGCATAWALAEQGWRSRLLDRQGAPAAGSLGQPGRAVPRHRQPAGRCPRALQPRRRARGAARGALCDRTARRQGADQRRAAPGELGPHGRRHAGDAGAPGTARGLRTSARCRRRKPSLWPAGAAPGLVLPRWRLGAAGRIGAILPAPRWRDERICRFESGARHSTFARPVASARCQWRLDRQQRHADPGQRDGCAAPAAAPSTGPSILCAAR